MPGMVWPYPHPTIPYVCVVYAMIRRSYYLILPLPAPRPPSPCPPVSVLPQKFQELLAEREQVQQEYDDLEGEVMLVSSELSAARDRISRLRAHLERSEQVHSLEKEKLKDKVGHVQVM